MRKTSRTGERNRESISRRGTGYSDSVLFGTMDSFVNTGETLLIMGEGSRLLRKSRH